MADGINLAEWTSRTPVREYLRLSDAMVEANNEESGEEGAPLSERKVATRLQTGIRFQRCGGGRRVIRRQGRRAV